TRYLNEVNRLYGVLDHRLSDREFIARHYSIADIAIWPWVRNYAAYDQKLDDFPNMKAWFERVGKREAVKKALDIGPALDAKTAGDQAPEELAKAAKVLFGQTARSVDAAAKQA